MDTTTILPVPPGATAVARPPAAPVRASSGGRDRRPTAARRGGPQATTAPPRKGGTTARRTDVAGTPPAQPGTKKYHALLGSLSVIVLLAVCGLSSWMIVLDERKGTDARAAGSAAPTVVPRDISSRAADPAPLTAKEVFPEAKIVISPVEPPYQILKTQTAKDCRVAAAGKIANLLGTLGCSQVVRATLRSPTGAYLVTGGIFNLEDRAGAEFARQEIRPMVDKGTGRFSGMIAGKGTEPIATSSAHVGWDIRGHFLLYCVIARKDGKKIASGDPYAAQILYDIVEMHLRDKVLDKRATVAVSPGASSPALPQTPG